MRIAGWLTARLVIAATTLASASAAEGAPPAGTLAPPLKPNVLYIVVDDLRPSLPVYGQRNIIAPHLSALANRSLIFDRAYCQQPVCSPSRNSFMTGRQPASTKIWNFISSFREVGPNWVTLPSHFKSHGYLTLGTGKLYHEEHPPNGDGANSWSDLPQQFSCKGSSAGGDATYCDPKMASCDIKGSPNAPNPRWCPVDAPMNTTAKGSLADVDTLLDAALKLRFAAGTRHKTGQPFFLGVGLRKPHLDWRIPQGFLDLYPADVPTAEHPVAQPGRPDVSIHGPYRSDGEEALWHGWGWTDPWTPMRSATASEMRRFYSAAVTFMDSMVGRLLAELDASGATDQTLVVFHSDHGWSLGENGDWRKFSLTELGTRVPLLVAAPWLPHTHGRRTSAVVELVDVMPTMAALAGLPPPEVRPGDAPLDGVSLAPLFADAPPPGGVKEFALSVYPRCPVNTSRLWERNWCIQVNSSQFGWMGYSLRSNQSRYTAWFRWDGAAKRPWVVRDPVNGTGGFYNELFSYAAAGDEDDFDALDTTEVAAKDPALAASMHAALLKTIGA